MCTNKSSFKLAYLLEGETIYGAVGFEKSEEEK
jgi:hypothetical protein